MKRLIGYLIALGLFATSAHALDCRDWKRLDDYAREDALAEAVSEIVWSGRNSSFNVNHPRIERCALSRIGDMFYEAGDLCAQGNRVGPRAIDEMIKDYVRSCIQ